jgi:hypothetical protein
MRWGDDDQDSKYLLQPVPYKKQGTVSLIPVKTLFFFFFFFLCGPPEVLRCRRSYGMVRPLDRSQTNSPEMKTSSFFQLIQNYLIQTPKL